MNDTCFGLCRRFLNVKCRNCHSSNAVLSHILTSNAKIAKLKAETALCELWATPGICLIVVACKQLLRDLVQLATCLANGSYV